MALSLHRRGVLTKLRHSAGQDVDGGCGRTGARNLTGLASHRRAATGLVVGSSAQ
jgi:23S rRNA (adenine2503-C2)-methyltransferase